MLKNAREQAKESHRNGGRTASATRSASTVFTCSGCPAIWTGLGRAHCAACHRTYSTAGLFTAHRRDVGGKGTCIDPTPDMRHIDGIWRGPEFERDWGAA